MKSAFMFPIYLAINKIQKVEENTEETDELGSKEGQIVGLIKDQRGKANSW